MSPKTIKNHVYFSYFAFLLQNSQSIQLFVLYNAHDESLHLFNCVED